MKLIDKEIIRAEIERRMNCFKNDRNTLLKASDNNLGLGARIAMCEEILSFLDTLEVKEVDLEEKATQLSRKYFPDEENIWARPNIEAQRCKSACIEIVEWLKAQKL